jgi:CDP-glycerol glycerophosphotransferase
MPFYRNSLYSYPRQWFFGILSALIQLFVKQKPNLIVLTSFHGDGYRGNTKVIFENLLHHPDLHSVWLSRNPKLVHELQVKFGPDKACILHSFRGIKLLAASRAVLMTHGTSDYPFMRLPRKAFLIQTYHGLPTKRGEYMRPKNDTPPGWIHRKILAYRFSKIDYFLTSSPEVTRIFSARFNLKPGQFIETGYPYTDEIIQASNNHDVIKYLLPIPNTSKTNPPFTTLPDKIILYAPTYRKLTPTRWFPFNDFDSGELQKFLIKYNVLLILRPHPNENPKLNQGVISNPRVAICSDKTLQDVAPLLSVCNVIVTDYSGIYLEGLLKDIPPVFLPYDLESYERGFPWDYHEVTPGPKPSTFHDFLIALESAFEGASEYSNSREQIRSKFFSQTDGKSTRRVITFLEDLLKSGHKPKI